LRIDGKRIYHATDYDNDKTISYDENWTVFAETSKIKKAKFIKKIKNFYYIGGSGGLYKTFSNGSIIKEQIGSCEFNGITYNDKDDLLYIIAEINVACHGQNCKKHVIYTYNLNLELIRTLEVDINETPFSINSFKGIVYIGSSSGAILMYKNDKMVERLQTKDAYSVTLINFEYSGHVIIGCAMYKQILLYNLTNFMFLRPFIALDFAVTVDEHPIDVIFDKPGSVVVVSNKAMYRKDISYEKLV
jgi:hypothetical protein